MYLRTTRRKNKDGSTVTYYHLAHHKKHSETGHPDSLQLWLGRFGWADQIDRQQLVRLCHSITRVCELTIEDSTSPLEQSQQKKWAEYLKLVQSRELGTIAVIEAL